MGFASLQNDLLGIILLILFGIAFVAFLIALLCLIFYYAITQKPYTIKEILLKSLLFSVIILIVSGFICGTTMLY